MGRRPTACLTCASIKAKCTGQKPCSRCQRLNVSCAYPRGQPAIAEHQAANASSPELSIAAWGRQAPRSPTKSRAHHTKSSKGCGNCRRRRKKCDEQWPVCGDCHRLQLQCLPRWATADHHSSPESVGESQTHQDRKMSGDLVGSSLDDAQIDALCRQGFNDLEDNGEDNAYASSGFDWLEIITKEISNSSTVSMLSLANSSALAVLPERRASDTAPSEDGVTLPPIALSNYAGLDATAQDGWTTGERYLMNHFLQAVARSMSMTEDRSNPFICLIVPMASESTAVRNAIAALSATHLSKLYPAFEKNHLMHRNRALEDLKWRLVSPPSAVASLTATLLLCLGEICECQSQKWLLYLHGARALLSQLETGSENSISAFLVDLYNYICCVGCCTSDITPLPWAVKFGIYRSGKEEEPHPLFGTDPMLYEFLSRINRHLQQSKRLISSEASFEKLEELRSKAEALEKSILEWPSSRDTLSEGSAAAACLRWALILRLRQEVLYPSLSATSAYIQGSVDNINSAMSLIRPGSRFEAHLLLPMFIAGVSSVTKASRLLLEYRISVAERTLGFGTVQSVHQMLDDLWKVPNNGGQAIAWKTILKEKLPPLMLF